MPRHFDTFRAALGVERINWFHSACNFFDSEEEGCRRDEAPLVVASKAFQIGSLGVLVARVRPLSSDRTARFSSVAQIGKPSRKRVARATH